RHTRFDCDWSSDVCSSDLSAGRKASAAAPPKSLALVVTALLSATSLLNAEENLDKKPDPAAHTVIVPFDTRNLPGAAHAQANRFYLDYADFQRLWALAKENRQPEKLPEDTGVPEA